MTARRALHFIKRCTGKPSPSLVYSKPVPLASKPTEKVAVVGLFTDPENGVSNFNNRMFLENSEIAACDVYIEDAEYLRSKDARFRPLSSLRANATHYAQILFIVANSKEHVCILDSLKTVPFDPKTKIHIYIHDVFCWHVLHAYYKATLAVLIEEAYSERPFLRPDSFQLLAERGILGMRLLMPRRGKFSLIVNSAYAARLVSDDIGLAGNPEVRRMFHPVIKAPLTTDTKTERASLRVGTFGHINSFKGMKVLFHAVKLISASRSVTLVVAGPNVYELETDLAELRNHGVTVEARSNLSEFELLGAMASVDVAVQLRPYSYGESSGVVSHLIALGKRLVVSEHGSFAEYGDAVFFVDRFPLPEELAEVILNASKKDNTEAVVKYASDHSVSKFSAELNAILTD
ncbi:MAG: glycosyltransferase family 1 protein [Proteobacteria bacterium]|nr:MAG: glycosyltransferase family 1 protein [Pseudomonadota bacterium]